MQDSIFQSHEYAEALEETQDLRIFLSRLDLRPVDIDRLKDVVFNALNDNDSDLSILNGLVILSELNIYNNRGGK